MGFRSCSGGAPASRHPAERHPQVLIIAPSATTRTEFHSAGDDEPSELIAPHGRSSNVNGKEEGRWA